LCRLRPVVACRNHDQHLYPYFVHSFIFFVVYLINIWYFVESYQNVLCNYMPPKRTDSSVPFQIATRSSTRTVATPLTPARVVVPTTQVSSPSLRGRASRLTYNLPVSATAASRVPEMALPQDLIDALTNLATAMGQDRTAAQTQSTALLNALNMQRLQS
jgi:hypothetical protein